MYAQCGGAGPLPLDDNGPVGQVPAGAAIGGSSPVSASKYWPGKRRLFCTVPSWTWVLPKGRAAACQTTVPSPVISRCGGYFHKLCAVEMIW